MERDTRRLHGLDTLRAAAIALVFMYHYMVFVSREATFGWASNVGWVGVDLFFVLSGYLIANQIFSGMAKGRRLSAKAFYIRRFLRTLPNYYVVLALYFLFPAVMGGKEPPPLWQFLTFTQNILLHPGTAFSHAWSLCIEEQFYLLLPPLVILAARYGRTLRSAWLALGGLMLGAIALRSLLWLQYGREGAAGDIAGYYPYVYYSTLCRFDEFLPGVAVALLKNFHPAAWQRIAARGNQLLVAGGAGVAGMFYLALHQYYIEGYGYGFCMSSFGYPLLAIAFAVVTVAALSPGSLLSRARVPGAAQLAAWSYAIYLSHKPLTYALHQRLADMDVGGWAEVMILIGASLAGGWLLYCLVETPFMELRDRYFPSSFPATAAPAASTATAAAQARAHII